MTSSPQDPKQEPLDVDVDVDTTDRLAGMDVDGRELGRRIAEAGRVDGAQA